MVNHNLDDIAAGVASDVNKRTNARKKTRTADQQIKNRNLGGDGDKPMAGAPPVWSPPSHNPQYVDVMNANETPGVGTKEEPFLNIDDTDWGIQSWMEGKIDLNLPPTKAIQPLGTGNPCLDNCAQKQHERMTKCEIVRQRVTDALMKAGCPTAYYPLQKVVNATGCTQYVLATNQQAQPLTPQYNPNPPNPFYAGQYPVQQPVQQMPQQMQGGGGGTCNSTGCSRV